jgi:hypothetical protein
MGTILKLAQVFNSESHGNRSWICENKRKEADNQISLGRHIEKRIIKSIQVSPVCIFCPGLLVPHTQTPARKGNRQRTKAKTLVPFTNPVDIMDIR